MSRELSFAPALAAERGPRVRIAALLHAASSALVHLASLVAPARLAGARRAEPVLEFYAEAGAPEGALYVDGRLVGFIEGVDRL